MRLKFSTANRKFRANYYTSRMDIKFTLYENHFKKEETEYMARVAHSGCCTQEQLVDEIAKRNVGIARSEIIAVLEEYQQAIIFALSEGKQITTPLFNTRTSIKGKFSRHNEPFHPKRHKVVVNLSTGKSLKACAAWLKGKRIPNRHPAPALFTIKDFASKTYDQQLTPGGICKIQGKNLKFDKAEPKQGIFLTSGATTLRIREIIDNMPSQLIFMLPPELPASPWQISVNAISGNSTVIRTGYFHKSLPVASILSQAAH